MNIHLGVEAVHMLLRNQEAAHTRVEGTEDILVEGTEHNLMAGAEGSKETAATLCAGASEKRLRPSRP